MVRFPSEVENIRVRLGYAVIRRERKAIRTAAKSHQCGPQAAPQPGDLDCMSWRLTTASILPRLRALRRHPATDSRAPMPASPGAALNRWAQKGPKRGHLPATGFAMGCYTKECSANEIAYLRST